MDAYWAFIAANRLLLSGVISLLIAGFLIWKNRDDLRFWWFNYRYGLPIVGELPKLAKDYESKDKQNCRLSEKQLCQDYMVHYDRFASKNADYYNNCKSYLGKVDERNRSPLPWYVAILTVALVFVEAMGFSYVLAGWTIPGASESTQQYGAVGIAFMISVILVLFTHWAGHELYQNSLIDKVRTWWLKDSSSNKPNTLVPSSNRVSLEDNHIDDDQPNYIQMLNRIDANASVTKRWMITVITAAIIVIVAVGATYVRGQVLEKQMIEEVTSQDDTFYGDMPSAVSETQSEPDKQALNEKQDADRKGGWGTFIVLAFIFIFLQFLGILFGFKWGFGGKESKLAWKDSHDFTTRESFVTFFQRKTNNIAKIAQGRLTDLHKKLQQAAMGGGVDVRDFNTNTKSFLDYVSDAKHEHASHVATTSKLTIEEAKPMDKLVKSLESLKCPACGNEVQKGAKFCPHCSASLESLMIVDPTCPTCGKHYDQGTKFCAEDATLLVSGDKLKPTCVKCGKVYPDGTKFCTEDGGEVKVGYSGE
jgi:hypothetical protein